MATKNSKTVLLNFDFDPKNYIVIDLLLNLKKTSEEKTIDRIIEKLPDDNDNLYIKIEKAQICSKQHAIRNKRKRRFI